MTLIDPAYRRETDRAEEIRGEIQTILAMRQSLARIPGTHAKRAEMLHECADLYDQLHALSKP